MPLEWDEVADCDPAAFTLATAPARFAERGDASAAIDSAAGSLDALLEQTVRKRGFGCYRRYQLAPGPDCALGDPAIRLRRTSRETLCPKTSRM